MRKLMSATIPNASGPHCWMTNSVSDQRNCARPRSMLQQGHHTFAQEAEHCAAAVPRVEGRLAHSLQEGLLGRSRALRPSSPERPRRVR